MMDRTLNSGSWAVQQLAGLLAGISSYDDEATMLQGAAHRIAEAVDAEVCAIVTADGAVPVAIGFPADEVPVTELTTTSERGGGRLRVAGLGAVDAAVVELAEDPPSHLVLARSSSAFTQDDLHLVRSMGQVLTLALQLRRTADRERHHRQRSEEQADALRRANAALLEASSTKDMFIAVASHELRTPLTSILGFASTLREHDERIDPATRSSYLAVIERQGDRLLRLIDDLLTVGRLDAGHAQPRPEPVPVVTALRVLLAVHDRSVTVHGSRTAMAHSDPDHLDQMILNLVTNAQKYGAAPVTIEVAACDDLVEVAVIDEGPGVPASFVPHLFDRFSQASIGESRESSGTGLGLAIVQGLATANHGNVRYERSNGRTRFVVRLPVAAPTDPPPTRPSDPSPAGRPADRPADHRGLHAQSADVP